MKFKVFLNEYGNVKFENKLLKFVIVVLTLGVLASLYYTNRALEREKVILIPPQTTQRIVFIGNKPNKAYFDQMTRYIISLALNYTSATAKGQFNALLKLFSPEAFKKYEPIFYDLANRVKAAGNVANSFYITDIKVYPDKKEIIVTGLQYTFSGNSLLKQKIEKYAIAYTITPAGRFEITAFGKIKGGE